MPVSKTLGVEDITPARSSRLDPGTAAAVVAVSGRPARAAGASSSSAKAFSQRAARSAASIAAVKRDGCSE